MIIDNKHARIIDQFLYDMAGKSKEKENDPKKEPSTGGYGDQHDPDRLPEKDKEKEDNKNKD